MAIGWKTITGGFLVTLLIGLSIISFSITKEKTDIIRDGQLLGSFNWEITKFTYDVPTQLSRMDSTATVTKKVNKPLTEINITKKVKFYKGITSQGILTENYFFKDTTNEKDFPTNYFVNWSGTGKSQLMLHLFNLKDNPYDGIITGKCKFNFGRIEVDIIDCDKFSYLTTSGTDAKFYFKNQTGKQGIIVKLSDPATNVNACSNLGAGSYILTQNIGSGGICLNVTADNVIIDGAGFTINGGINASNATGPAWNNLTVLNAVITGGIYAQGGVSEGALTSVLGSPSNSAIDTSIGTKLWFQTGTIPDNIKVKDAAFVSANYTSDSSIVVHSIRLVKAGTIVGSNLGNSNSITTSFTSAESYGNTTNLWGTTWTAAEVNANNFGVVVAYNRTTEGITQYLKATRYFTAITGTIIGIQVDLNHRRSPRGCATSGCAEVDYIGMNISYKPDVYYIGGNVTLVNSTINLSSFIDLGNSAVATSLYDQTLTLTNAGFYNNFGSISYYSTSTRVVYGANLPLAIVITNNSAYVESTTPAYNLAYNKSAVVKLNLTGWGISYPWILEDNANCLTKCNVLSYTNNLATFNVTSFSNYTISEGMPKIAFDSTSTLNNSYLNASKSSQRFFINVTLTQSNINQSQLMREGPDAGMFIWDRPNMSFLDYFNGTYAEGFMVVESDTNYYMWIGGSWYIYDGFGDLKYGYDYYFALGGGTTLITGNAISGRINTLNWEGNPWLGSLYILSNSNTTFQGYLDYFQYSYPNRNATYNLTSCSLLGICNSTETRTVHLYAEPSVATMCNPTLNTNWVIIDAQKCDGTNTALGSGGIVITGGNLTLVNGANVTAKGINISVSGDRVFINKGCELRV